MLEKQSNSRLTSDKAMERSKELREQSSARKSYLLKEAPSAMMIIDPPAPYSRREQKKN